MIIGSNDVMRALFSVTVYTIGAPEYAAFGNIQRANLRDWDRRVLFSKGGKALSSS